jgi:hypothetical protein
LALWSLGHPEAALADADQALKEAREIGQATTLMFGLRFASFPHIFCGNYATANALLNELLVLADGKGAFYWKAHGMSDKGSLLALTGKAPASVQMINAGTTAFRSTGATFLCLYTYHAWRELMPNSVNSMMLGAVLAMRWAR